MATIHRTSLPGSAIRRIIVIAALALGVVAFFASGLHTRITFDALALRYEALTGLVAAYPLLAPLAAVMTYALITAFSIPVAWLLTVALALIFGWLATTVYVVIGATLGACLLYIAARWALADWFRARAGGAVAAMAAGFRRDAAGYLLFLRLTPVFPFALVNIVPAILGVPLVTYAWTTLFGIIPGTAAYALAGEGLRSVIGARAQACAADVPPCGQPLAAGDLVTPQIIFGFVVLGLVSLLPILVKRWRGRNAQPSDT